MTAKSNNYSLFSTSHLKKTTPQSKLHKQDSQISLTTQKEFIIGDFNKKVVQIIEQMINGNQKWSPLFIYSGSGLGKTYLLTTIIKMLKSNKIYYTGGLDFISLVFEKFALSSSEIESWKQSFLKYDFFMFDDIHFLANKTKTNEILFQILSVALRKKKNIIFTAEIHPENFVGFAKRLKSRFQKGLVLEIEKPNIADSIYITEQKLKLFCPKLKVTNEVIRLIASSFAYDIRRLEGALKRISYQTEFDKTITKIDLKILKKIFRNAKWISHHQVSIIQIQTVVARFFNLSRKELIDAIKKTNVVHARYTALFLAKKFTHLNSKQLAHAFNLKSHATVLNAIKKTQILYTSDLQFKKQIENLTKLCQKSNLK